MSTQPCPFCQSLNTSNKGREFRKYKNSFVRRFKCNSCSETFYDDSDMEIIKENVKLSKQKQKFQDLNRIQNKAFRENARIENAIESYNEQILAILKEHDFKKVFKVHPIKNAGAVGIVQISDLHLNELVDILMNKYDFNVAAKRLQLYVDSAIKYFQICNVKNVLIADTGDKLNSDRRLDEYLNQSTNRSNATMLAVHLLKQVILHLNEHFNLTYACVTGNESRVKDEPGYSKIVATDNYDFTIFNILRYMFNDCNIDFIIGDPSELIINVNGQNVLLLHGNTIRGDVTKTVTGIKGKYADKGILISYILFGDIHESRIGDSYTRSSSMVGDNDYSFKGLHLTGRASQTLQIFYNNGNRDSIKVDLQNVAGVKGYDIIKELESYNAKSSDKLNTGTAIMKIVI